MAKLSEEIVVIKVSTLVPDSEQPAPVLSDDNIQALRLVLEEMAGGNRTLVEIERA